MHSLLLIPDKLLTRSDNLHCINQELSINFILYIVVLPLSCYFLIGTEKVMYFSVFSSKHSNWPLNSYGKCLVMKCQSYVEPLWNDTGISLGNLYFKLQILWAAPPNFPVKWQWSLTFLYCLNSSSSLSFVQNSFLHMWHTFCFS